MHPYPIRKFRVREHRQETMDTFTLVLEPADGEPMFVFKAGQFIMLHLFNADGTVWAKSAYSMAMAPVESKDHLELGIKITGDFTKRCSSLSKGDEVGVQGPYGMFTLREDTNPLVFFAGGVGVTPLKSMIRSYVLDGGSSDVFLFYSGKTREVLAYEQEFRDLAKAHKNFHPILILTQEAPEGWDGEHERISIDMVKKYVPDAAKGRAFVCGPKPFMDAVRAILAAMGMDVASRLHKETF